jgi:hypothetical protein
MTVYSILRCVAMCLLASVTALHAAGPGLAPLVAGHVTFVDGAVTVTNAEQAARAVQSGDPVYVGDRIQTPTQSHIYLRMVDNAFVALRPGSELTISTYEFDKDQPQASRIRLDLQQGTSRAVSGKGGQAAKHQYRFNTPLAAIGLRGTDYTVVADAEKTRVSVAQGGVIVSPYGAGCSSVDLGPCLTPLARELTANMPNAFIEVTPNQAPRVMSGTLAQAAPAAAPVPVRSEAAAVAVDDPAKRASLQLSIERAETSAAVVVAAAEVNKVLSAPDLTPSPAVPQRSALAQWGRWSALIQQIPAGSPSISTVFSRLPDFQIVGANDSVALAYPGSVSTSLPDQGRVQFSLVAAEAYVKDGSQFTAAGVKSGQLMIDFGQSNFSTQLAVLTSPNHIETVQAQGTVDAYGRMQSSAALSNSNVGGIVLNKGQEATYLFDKTLSLGSTLSGAAQWFR